MRVERFEHGIAIHGKFPSKDVLDEARKFGPFPLVIADPPYGNILDEEWDVVHESDKDFASYMIGWTKEVQKLTLPNAALYVWGGVGRPGFRPWYRYIVRAEEETGFLLANHITWSKKRAYGVQHNYLFTREELAYFILGPDIKKPRLFNVPLLATKRGYAGYNPEHPAKSEFFRRTNVWMDITEIFKGKIHEAQKQVALHEIMISAHTRENEWVFDPFAGSGTTGEACKNLGRNFVLVESGEKEFEVCVNRLRGLYV